MKRRLGPLLVTTALVAGTYLLWYWLTASETVHEVVLATPASVA